MGDHGKPHVPHRGFKARPQYTWANLDDLRSLSVDTPGFIGNLQSIGLNPDDAPPGALHSEEAQVGYDQEATRLAKAMQGDANGMVPTPPEQIASFVRWMACYLKQGARPTVPDIGPQAAVVVPGGGTINPHPFGA